MARSRNIKPGFFLNDDLLELDFASRLLFAGLWTIADRLGRLEDRPKKIKIAIFPADDVDVSDMLFNLDARKLIKRYSVDGCAYIAIPSWSKHQNPHHTEKCSVIPDENGVLTVKEPLKPSDTPLPDGEYLADSLLLIPSSLIPDPLPTKVDSSADKLPICQHEKVVEIYHKVMPTLPSVKLMGAKRKKAIGDFWKWILTSKKADGNRRATDSQQALEWVESYFERATQNDFLMGRGFKAPGHEGWECTLDFLLTDRGMQHVIEKTRDTTTT